MLCGGTVASLRMWGHVLVWPVWPLLLSTTRAMICVVVLYSHRNLPACRVASFKLTSKRGSYHMVGVLTYGSFT